jgi:hypothetical protein
MINDYRDLLVWQKSMDLVVDCYRLTEQFPRTEIYGLTSQLRRSAVSVPSNIAEGRGRQHLPDHSVSAYCFRFALRTGNTNPNRPAPQLHGSPALPKAFATNFRNHKNAARPASFTQRPKAATDALKPNT